MTPLLVNAPTQSAVQTHALLLLQLRQLMQQGKGDSSEADAIRDDMDPSWYLMNREEQERIANLSADFYDLAEGGPKPLAMTAEERMCWEKSWRQAHEKEQWDTLLAAMRHPPADLPRHQVLFLMGRTYEKLGLVEAGAVFMDEVERLCIRNGNTVTSDPSNAPASPAATPTIP